MTQADKELLLKDLTARLPYGVKYKDINLDFVGTITDISMYDNMCKLYNDYGDNYTCYIVNCKPYLFPLSSMTEEQKEEYESLCVKETSECTDLYGIIFTTDYYHDTVESIDYLYKNHIDIRGLIPKGLANDATGLNIY